MHGYKWAAEGKNPADAMGNLFAIEDSLYKTGQSRASATDAANFVWMAKANQLYNLEKQQSQIKAKVRDKVTGVAGAAAEGMPINSV